MTTALFSHAACADHDPGPGHPERPARLAAVLAALDGDEFAALERRQAPAAGDAMLGLAHPAGHVARTLAMVPAEGHAALDPDTRVSPGSGEAARRAAGAVCAAVDAVAGGAVDNAFCAVRPPGHHAEAARAMGFCLFNNIAIGALHARAAHGIERVAVVDFDVHHGNGTQAIFERDPGLFYGSTHEYPQYPGTGAVSETGVGNIVNAPMAPGSDSAVFRAAMTERILPALENFAPDLLLVSAGFDAHRDDPLASITLVEEDFAWITGRLLEIAAGRCDGRLVSVLEGGYDLAALGRSAAAHVRALSGHTGPV